MWRVNAGLKVIFHLKDEKGRIFNPSLTPLELNTKLPHLSCPYLLWRSENPLKQAKTFSTIWLVVTLLLVFIFVILWVVMSLSFYAFGVLYCAFTCNCNCPVLCIVLCFCYFIFVIFALFQSFFLVLYGVFSLLCSGYFWFVLVIFVLRCIVVLWQYIQPHTTRYCTITHRAHVPHLNFRQEYISGQSQVKTWGHLWV